MPLNDIMKDMEALDSDNETNENSEVIEAEKEVSKEEIVAENNEIKNEEVTENASNEEVQPVVEQPIVESQEVVAETPIEEEYKPNYGYKVLNEDREMPEFVRAAINKENEELFRDLFTKADGLEAVKSKRDEYKEQYDSIISNIAEIDKMLVQGDVKGFWKTIGQKEEDLIKSLDEEAILKAATEILKREELPAEAKQAYSRSNNLEMENKQLNMQLNEINNNFATQAQKITQLEIDRVFSQDSVKEAKRLLDSRAGEGSFEAAVGEIGMAHYDEQRGDTISVQEAVDMVINRYGLVQQDNAPAPKKAVSDVPVETKVKVVTKNTIPNVGEASGETPASKSFASLDDLKKERDSYLKKLGMV